MDVSRLFAHCLMGPLLAIALAAPALASELLEGEGYSLRVPPGFRAMPKRDCGG